MSVIDASKDKMIDMLLSGINITEIARTLDVSRQTIYAWKKEDVVEAELERRREQLKKSAQDKITESVCTYVDNMKELASKSTTDIRVRYQANKYLIDQCLGSPNASKEDAKIDAPKGTTDPNELKKEIEDIKNLRVVK